MQPSPIKRHAILIGGHRTAISVEDVFWNEIRHMAIDRNTTVSKLVEQIDTERRQKFQRKNLSSAIRLFVLNEIQKRAA